MSDDAVPRRNQFELVRQSNPTTATCEHKRSVVGGVLCTRTICEGPRPCWNIFSDYVCTLYIKRSAARRVPQFTICTTLGDNNMLRSFCNARALCSIFVRWTAYMRAICCFAVCTQSRAVGADSRCPMYICIPICLFYMYLWYFCGLCGLNGFQRNYMLPSVCLNYELLLMRGKGIWASFPLFFCYNFIFF